MKRQKLKINAKIEPQPKMTKPTVKNDSAIHLPDEAF
jgi:hypothetical protein